MRASNRVAVFAALGLIAGSAGFLGPQATAAEPPDEGEDQIVVDVLGMNDFHGRLEADGQSAGAAVLAGAVQEARAANPDTLFVSAGDDIGASTFVSFVQDDEPTIEAWNEAGLDVAAAGNHEFDKGADDLTGRVADLADYPIIGANVLEEDGESLLPPTQVVETESGVRVGFIGALTTDMPSLVTPSGIEGLEFPPYVDIVNDTATELTESGEADVVVVLAHDGASNDSVEAATGDTPYGDLVTGANADVDAILSGHTHQTYAHSFEVEGWDDGLQRPVLQSGQYGENLDKLSFTLDEETHDVVGIDGELVDLVDDETEEANFPAHEGVQQIVDEAVEEADDLGAEELGEITADLNRARQSDGTTENRGGESTLGNLVADVQLWATQPDDAADGSGAQIALMNPGGLRQDLSAGDDGVVTYREAADVQPFANTLVTMTLTGDQIESVLEQQWQPSGTERAFLKLGVSAGFTYTYDPGAEQGERITSMRLDDEPVEPEEEYRVTANSFLASGGDNFTTFAEGTDVQDSGQVDLEAFVRYMEEFSPVTPDYAQRAVGMSWQSDPEGSYAESDEVAVDISSLLFSTDEPTDEVLQAELAGFPVGEFEIDDTVVDGTDEVGQASVAFDVPAEATDVAEGRET
ncbi:MAG TPA: bifunctional UDP-sugar hydrolase/5'-nucleotidase, partial [Jiangellaceae bacterium]|nr:bifunctional UDP-sugar hydrolase/5'-nucleotidase [Jiangellaceae bacterium]